MTRMILLLLIFSLFMLNYLIYELDRAPDFLVREVLDFFLFIKTRANEQHRQESSHNPNPKEAEIPLF